MHEVAKRHEVAKGHHLSSPDHGLGSARLGLGTDVLHDFVVCHVTAPAYRLVHFGTSHQLLCAALVPRNAH